MKMTTEKLVELARVIVKTCQESERGDTEAINTLEMIVSGKLIDAYQAGIKYALHEMNKSAMKAAMEAFQEQTGGKPPSAMPCSESGNAPTSDLYRSEGSVGGSEIKTP